APGVDHDEVAADLERNLTAGVEDDLVRLEGDGRASFEDDGRRFGELLDGGRGAVAGAVPVEAVPLDDVRLLALGEDEGVALDVQVVVLVDQLPAVAVLVALAIDAA